MKQCVIVLYPVTSNVRSFICKIQKLLEETEFWKKLKAHEAQLNVGSTRSLGSQEGVIQSPYLLLPLLWPSSPMKSEASWFLSCHTLTPLCFLQIHFFCICSSLCCHSTNCIPNLYMPYIPVPANVLPKIFSVSDIHSQLWSVAGVTWDKHGSLELSPKLRLQDALIKPECGWANV